VKKELYSNPFCRLGTKSYIARPIYLVNRWRHYVVHLHFDKWVYKTLKRCDYSPCLVLTNVMWLTITKNVRVANLVPRENRSEQTRIFVFGLRVEKYIRNIQQSKLYRSSHYYIYLDTPIHTYIYIYILTDIDGVASMRVLPIDGFVVGMERIS